MKRDFDFEEVGKKIPYQVPADFFDKMQENVMGKLAEAERKPQGLTRFIPIGLAAAAVLSAVAYLPLRHQNVEDGRLTQATVVEDPSWIEDMSDEDLESMNVFTECDIFMK